MAKSKKSPVGAKKELNEEIVVENEETEMAEHNHAELEAKIEALEARIAELEKNDLLEAAEAKTHKIVEVAFDGIADVVEAKVKKAVANIQSGKVDFDFEEIFQWINKRRRNGRPFNR